MNYPVTNTLLNTVIDFINNIPRVDAGTQFVSTLGAIIEIRCIDLSLPRQCGKTYTLSKLYRLLPEAYMVTRTSGRSTYSLSALNNYLNFTCRGTRNQLTYLLVDEVEMSDVLRVLSRYPMHISPNLVIVRLATNTH